eukprot:7379658-Prymnesium_polylepis.1
MYVSTLDMKPVEFLRSTSTPHRVSLTPGTDAAPASVPMTKKVSVRMLTRLQHVMACEQKIEGVAFALRVVMLRAWGRTAALTRPRARHQRWAQQRESHSSGPHTTREKSTSTRPNATSEPTFCAYVSDADFPPASQADSLSSEKRRTTVSSASVRSVSSHEIGRSERSNMGASMEAHFSSAQATLCAYVDIGRGVLAFKHERRARLPVYYLKR